MLHTGIHNTSGSSFREEAPRILSGKTFYSFSLIYPNKTRCYYIDNLSDYKKWINCLKINIPTFQNIITNLYDIGVNFYYLNLKPILGKGVFGIVHEATNKLTEIKVAIKIIYKKNMTDKNLNLIRSEIEILKICQHPNIVRLIDSFDDIDNIYIVMEYCEGGDLANYFENKGCYMPEDRVCQLIHKLMTAIYYLHSYGIVHRDLKLENILMTSLKDESDIRVLDFGLSKIIGPSEYCNEPFGTIVNYTC